MKLEAPVPVAVIAITDMNFKLVLWLARYGIYGPGLLYVVEPRSLIATGTQESSNLLRD